jgi:hypothetical protein
VGGGADAKRWGNPTGVPFTQTCVRVDVKKTTRLSELSTDKAVVFLFL